MIITICPRCGAMNVTTTCTKCGWSQLTKSTVSTGVYKTIGELEIKMSGKALLDDYKRLLFENNSLTARIAELEGLAQQLVWVGNDLLTDNTNPVAITLFSGLAFRSKELLP